MEERPFLDGYTGQTVDELIALEATHRVDSIVLAFHQALLYKAHHEGDSSLSPTERIVVVIEEVEREVNNGGYHLFFFNSSREYASEIEAAFTAIGCPQNADLAKRAVAALGIGNDFDSTSIEGALERGGEALVDALNVLDAQYYRCDEDIGARLFAFIKEQKASIRLR